MRSLYRIRRDLESFAPKRMSGDIRIATSGNGSDRQQAMASDTFKSKSGSDANGSGNEGFRFRPRAGRFNWRLLHTLSVDTIMRSGDTTQLDEIRENLMSAKFSEDDLQIVNDAELTKLVQITQLSMELLHNRVVAAEAESRRASVNLINSKANQEKLEDGVRRLQRELRDRKRQCSLYENLLGSKNIKDNRQELTSKVLSQ